MRWSSLVEKDIEQGDAKSVDNKVKRKKHAKWTWSIFYTVNYHNGFIQKDVLKKDSWKEFVEIFFEKF